MATATHPLIRHIRRLAGARPTPDLPDALLLARFAAGGDEAAFEALVRRHGPLVLGVCRRVLGDWHAAEDCFQVAFALLARKAGSLRQPERVGPWLFGVAYRTALKARACAARRGACERNAATPSAVEEPDDLVWRDLRPVLDEAVARLPEKYRAAFVLHYLQGVSVDDVARRLGWPRGTVATRLARARERLRKGLARRGLTLPGAGLVAGLSAAVPARLKAGAVRAAGEVLAGRTVVPGGAAAGAALGKGGLSPMFTLRWKGFAAVLLLAALGAGGTSLLPRGARAEKPEGAATPDAVRLAAAEGVPPGKAPGRQPTDIEEAIYRTLREQGRWQAGGGYTVFVKRLQGRRLLDVVVVRGGPELAPFAARAREGTLQIDREGRAALFDLTEVTVTAEGGTGRSARKALAVPLPTAPARAAAVEGKRPVVEKKFRQYQVEVTLVRADAGGGDRGPHGKGKVLGEPRLLTLEGREAAFHTGGDVAVPADEAGTTEFLPVGLTVRVKVRQLQDGRLRVDASLERSEGEASGEAGWRLRRSLVEAVERVKLGEEVKLVEKDGRGRPLHWALVRVVREESVRSRTEAGEAEKGTNKGKGKPAYVVEPPDVLQIDSAEGLLTPPVRGPHLVRPDGTVGLGPYGSASVAGRTLAQARAEIARVIQAGLGPGGKSLKAVVEGLSVDVLVYASRAYYVIADLAGQGEEVYRFPVTGKETVRDAVARVKGLPAAASRCRLWVERPDAQLGGRPQVLRVDWVGITRGGQARTNYQLLPGDRLYVKGAGK
jgi:RNA polymerase sigma factor (sigma-70 family)